MAEAHVAETARTAGGWLARRPLPRIRHIYDMGHDPAIVLGAPVLATNTAQKPAEMKGGGSNPVRLNVNGGRLGRVSTVERL